MTERQSDTPKEYIKPEMKKIELSSVDRVASIAIVNKLREEVVESGGTQQSKEKTSGQ